MTGPDDDLDTLLTPRPGGPSPGVREVLRERTGRHLVRQRRAYHVQQLAACTAAAAAVFAAGAWVGRSTRPAPPQDIVFLQAPEPAVVPVPVVVPVPTPVPDESRPAPPAEIAVTAPQAEVKAELADDPADAARLYRLAGDKYLTDRQDYRNAARCYRLFLARAGDTGLSPDPADTWLLTSLKNAAFKEKYDAAHRDD